MKKYKMKNNGTAGISPYCQWMFPNYDRCGTANPNGGGLVNGMYFCGKHIVYFEHVDRQFKILEEIEEDE